MKKHPLIPIKDKNSFPKSTEVRRKAIKEALENQSSIVETGRRIPGLSGRPHDIREVDIDYLIYNFHNYRFFIDRATREREYGENYHSDDQNRIEAAMVTENRIWDQDVNDNEKTIESLLKNGQREPAVCDLNGVVVSGNRRLTLLHQIKRRRAEGMYTNIDPARLDELSKIRVKIEEKEFTDDEIELFETRLQHTADNKQDYDPVNKYFIVRNLRIAHGKSNQEIYDDNNGMPSLNGPLDVDKFIRVADLMEDYLSFIKLPNMFSELKGLEDPFRRLDDDLIKIEEGKINHLGNREIQKLQYKNAYFTALRTPKGKESGIKEKWYRDFYDAFSNNTGTWQKLNKAVASAVSDFEGPTTIETDKVKETKQKWDEKHSEEIAESISDVIDEVKDHKKFNEKPEKLLSRISNDLEAFERMITSEDKEEYLEGLEDVSDAVNELYRKLDRILNFLPQDDE